MSLKTVDPTSIFTEKNPICTAWKAQSAENARAAMHTSVRYVWTWRRMAVRGQLCRVAEGLSYKDITLAHHCPPPSPQKSDTCANPVQKFRRAAPFLQRDNLVSYKSVLSGNLTWSWPVQISTSKIASWRSGRFSAVEASPDFPPGMGNRRGQSLKKMR